MSKNLPRKHLDYRGVECLNCGTPLDIVDKYCHQCGQLNTTKRLALKDFFNEFLSNFISYDSKAWRTITHLVFKPGFVTREYCEGKRMSYSNPFRFFLTVTIVFFLLIQIGLFFSENDSFIESANLVEVDFDNENGALVMDNDSIQSKEQVIEILQQQLDSISKIKGIESIAQKAMLESAIKKIEEDKNLNINSIHEYESQKSLDSLAFFKQLSQQIGDYTVFYEKNSISDPEKALKRLNHRVDKTNISRYKKAVKLSELGDNPYDVLSIILPKIPVFLFFFAPFISLFFWLIYIRGPWSYMEHMVFNFHLLSFIFLVFYIIAAESFLFDTSWIANIFFLIIGPFYLYKAMRKFYRQGRLKTIIKFIMINFAFVILLTISSTIFMLVSVFANL